MTSRFEKFHGADMVALDGTQSLLQIANLVASAFRGRTQRRNKLLTQPMQNLVVVDDDSTIAVRYLELADFLGSRTALNGVLLRETSRTHLARIIRSGIHNLRRKGLDVELIRDTRQGEHDVLLVIKPSFKHDDEAIPTYMRESATPPSLDVNMEEIMALGAPRRGRAA